jgi:hypothetical protein
MQEQEEFSGWEPKRNRIKNSSEQPAASKQQAKCMMVIVAFNQI